MMQSLPRQKQKLIEQRPLVLGYVTDEVKDKIISGEGYLGLVYSGEAGKAMEEKDTLKYAIPQDGTAYCVDAMVVPANAKNKVSRGIHKLYAKAGNRREECGRNALRHYQS